MLFFDNIDYIIDDYEYFIIDLWGVIHDGSNIYKGAGEAIKKLRNKNKKICFLSNAPRRSIKAAQTLEKFHILTSDYDFIMTSGESTFLDLKNNQQNKFDRFGKKYFYIGPDKDYDLLDGLDYKSVDSAKEADFAIATGFDSENSTLEEKLPQIISAKENDLPLICVNPDFIVVRQNGNKMLCAGVLAEEYKKMNGKVIYHGKPFIDVYNAVYDSFDRPNKSKILAIGDGIETDIKGANNFGIDSALITGGILCTELGVQYGEKADESMVERICNSYQIFPKIVISGL